jgi:hypothetical protein
MYAPVKVFLLLLLALLQISFSLDVSWIPSDPDGPLPLSAQYRASLEKLCVLIREQRKLPKELLEKKATLRKMCKRLDDDKLLVTNFPLKLNKATVGILLALGGGAAIWVYRDQLWSLMQSLIPSITKLEKRGDDLAAVREARMKRFYNDDLSKDD